MNKYVTQRVHLDNLTGTPHRYRDPLARCCVLAARCVRVDSGATSESSHHYFTVYGFPGRYNSLMKYNLLISSPLYAG